MSVDPLLNIDMSALMEAAKEFNAKKSMEKELERSEPLQRESVLGALHAPHEFMFRRCDLCNATYKTDTCTQTYCSDTCVTQSLRDMLGEGWHRSPKSVAGYVYERARIIGPEYTESIYEWAKSFVDAYEYTRDVQLPKDKPRPYPQRVRIRNGVTQVEYLAGPNRPFDLPRQEDRLTQQEPLTEEPLEGQSLQTEELLNAQSLVQHTLSEPSYTEDAQEVKSDLDSVESLLASLDLDF